jgi:nickel transport protein
MRGAVMKSLVRQGTALILIGSAIIGSTLFGSMQALALSPEQIEQKLGPVPVFTITDGNGAPLVAKIPNGNKQENVAGVFINQKDAQSFVDQLKTKNPDLGKSVKVIPVSLGEVYKLEQANRNKPNAPNFQYVPAQQEVNSALTLLQQSGQKIDNFNGTPLFVARAGKDKGYLTIRRNNQEVIPFFFNKEELQTMVNRFKQQKPDLAGTVQIQVISLEGMIQTLKTRNDSGLNEVVLVPPQESIDYVRSLQQATPAQQNSGQSPANSTQSPKQP